MVYGSGSKFSNRVWTGGEDRATHFEKIAEGQGATMSLPTWALYMKKVYADPTLNISQEDFEIPEYIGININCGKGNKDNKDNIEILTTTLTLT